MAMRIAVLIATGVLLMGGLIIGTPARAGGTHTGGHGAGHGHAGGHHAAMTVGQPGNTSEADRAIDVVMKETDDGQMLFEPNAITLARNETIRFRIINDGELEHEFVLDDHAGIIKHKAHMEEMPDMVHEDPNSLRLATGTSGEIIWKFVNTGPFAFACLVPGHYDAGMKGSLSVTTR